MKAYRLPLTTIMPTAVSVFLWRTTNVKTFKSHADLAKLHPDDPALPVMKTLVKQLID
jgi:hypothetical protein